MLKDMCIYKMDKVLENLLMLAQRMLEWMSVYWLAVLDYELMYVLCVSVSDGSFGWVVREPRGMFSAVPNRTNITAQSVTASESPAGPGIAHKV
jgi:hypothetical protein